MIPPLGTREHRYGRIIVIVLESASGRQGIEDEDEDDDEDGLKECITVVANAPVKARQAKEERRSKV